MTKKIPYAKAICYSGYRENQSPSGVHPTDSQIIEDLNILVKDNYSYIRMYDPNDYAESVCRIIRENALPLKLMLGPGLINEVNNTGCEWNKTIYTDEELKIRREHNENQFKSLVQLANKYKDVIFAVSVGNENTPDWGENSVPQQRLCHYADLLHKETDALVTFNEGALEWPKLTELAKHLDVISIHSYPLWYGLTLEEAIDANKKDYANVKACYPNKEILFSEAGWTTSSIPGNRMIVSETNVENMKKYYESFYQWIEKEEIVSFMFEAFDEPWKGGSNPAEAEKHWGIYNVDRSPK